MAFSRTWLDGTPPAACKPLARARRWTAQRPGCRQPSRRQAALMQARSTLDAAIEAAGGEAALSRVQELHWTGTAKTTAADKVTELGVATIVRPFLQRPFLQLAGR